MNETKMMTNLDAFLSYGLILEDYLLDKDNSIYIPRVLETELRLSESYLNDMLTDEVKELEDINLIRILYKYITDIITISKEIKETDAFEYMNIIETILLYQGGYPNADKEFRKLSIYEEGLTYTQCLMKNLFYHDDLDGYNRWLIINKNLGGELYMSKLDVPFAHITQADLDALNDDEIIINDEKQDVIIDIKFNMSSVLTEIIRIMDNTNVKIKDLPLYIDTNLYSDLIEDMRHWELDKLYDLLDEITADLIYLKGMMQLMNVLSLFDGISCGRIALDKAGIQVNEYYASEIDKYAINISKSNYPNIIQLGDVCDIKGVVLETLPKIDLILAGSPC